jgi:hypothetical protein
MYEQQSTQYQNNLCEKLRATKSRSVYSQSIWHQVVIDEPFQKATCHLSFWIKWKHFRTRFSENMISTNCAYTQNSILRKTVRIHTTDHTRVEPKWFQNLWRRASNAVQSKLQALKETREQEAFNVSEEQQDHKIWVDIQVEQNRLLQAMVDSEAINNYILQQAIRMLELTLQWALKPMQVYMVNGESSE